MNTEELFPLDPEKVYFSTDMLTLETDGQAQTCSIGKWLNTDPVRIHKMIIKEKTLQVDTFEVLNPLVSKLRRADPEYYKRFMGLKLVIDFPGFPSGIVARIPFDNDPVGFYKWWRKGKHEDKVHLSEGYKKILFQRVYLMEPKMILKKDLELLG